jgi:hypothetical protein
MKEYISIPRPKVMSDKILEKINEGWKVVHSKQEEFNNFLANNNDSLELQINNLMNELDKLEKWLGSVAINCACERTPFSWREDYEAGVELKDAMVTKLASLRVARNAM